MTYTPYAAIAAVVAALLALALGRRRAALAAAASAAVLLLVLVPRVLPDRGEAERARGAPALRVLTANVLGGRGSPGALLRIVRRERVDVLAVQELTPRLDARLRDAFPHRVVRPRPGTPGTGIYSRLPLRRRSPPDGTGFAWTRAEVAGRVDLHSVHPVAPLRRELMGMWRRDLRALPPVVREGPPRVLAGDFNASLDHRELRRVLSTGYRDAAEVAGSGLRGTWPNGSRRLPPVAIDHVLADGACAIGDVRVLTLPGSDHSPVLAEVRCP